MPAVTFTVEDLSNATEGGGTGQFRVTANGDSSDFNSTVVAVWGYSGSATYTTDYTTNPTFPSYLNFSSPGSTQTITITAVDDETIEGNETVTLTVQRYTMFPTGPQYSDSLTLHDNDPLVTVSRVADAVEGGSTGAFRFTRTGSTSASLGVGYTVQTTGPGIAGSGSDYTALSGSVSIPSGQSYVDVTVTALADNVAEYDEDVVVTLNTSSNYFVGGTGTASIYIADNPDTAEALVHEETFTLTGTSGSVSVDLEVVYNADGADGLYTWTYTVTNPEEEEQDWTDFAIPIEEIDDDVDNLQSDLGWTGAIGSTGVSWTVGGGTILAPGLVGTFSFTTLPRLAGADTISLSATGAVADLPTAPAPRVVGQPNHATVSFPGGATELHRYTIAVEITTASGATVTMTAQSFNLFGATDARDYLLALLHSAGIHATRLGNNSLYIHGQAQGGRIDAIKTVKVTITNIHTGSVYPVVNASPGVEIIP